MSDGPETDRAAPYVILVEFALAVGADAAFEALILENARRSLSDEPGCRVFDVCAKADDAYSIVLYEVYADRAAFDAHLAAPHFKAFDEASAALVTGKRVTELTLLTGASG
ncbi:putative quinol monooxygenase [Aurantimonas sp. A2-1-M11]|uniref:putative quinol monooxygenase n=1 Tax=Aurantimonas sp. A2-1-M11 TaxID=3113712 RepID=UPI002F924816